MTRRKTGDAVNLVQILLICLFCSAVTENTRASYPIDYIPNARIPCMGPHPKNLILLCCDAFGVLPPVSRLTKEQAMYHFISGYTAKVCQQPLVHVLACKKQIFNCREGQIHLC